MSLKLLDSLHPNINTSIKNEIKKKIDDLLTNIIELLYKNNFSFYKISFTNISYKEIYYFLINYSKENKNYVFSDKPSNSDILQGFIFFLKDRFESSERFEFFLCFYDDTEETFSINCLLCLKVFGLDSTFDIQLYLNCFFKIFFRFQSISSLSSLEDIQEFYHSNINVKAFVILYNQTKMFHKNHILYTQTYLYNLLLHYLEYFGLSFCIYPITNKYYSNYPVSLEKINKRTPLSIINLISIYLNSIGGFLDLKSLYIYKKVDNSKSSLCFFCSLVDLQKKFPFILFYLKGLNPKEFAFSFEFYNPPYPIFTFFFNKDDFYLVESAFSLLVQQPFLVQSVNIMQLDVIEYLNGFYSLRDNYFYSSKYLHKYYPENEFKFNKIVSYQFFKKKFIKNYFEQHELMAFLKSNFSKLDFIYFFKLFFNTTPFVTDFSLNIILLSKINRVSLFNFLKSVYSNYPFIFKNYTSLSSCLNEKHFCFVDTLPLFIFETSINYSILSYLYKTISSEGNKPLSIILIIDSIEDVDELKLISDCLFKYNIIRLEASYNNFFNILKKYSYTFDLFIIMNMYYFSLNKYRKTNNFLTGYRLKSPEGGDPFEFDDF